MAVVESPLDVKNKKSIKNYIVLNALEKKLISKVVVAEASSEVYFYLEYLKLIFCDG